MDLVEETLTEFKEKQRIKKSFEENAEGILTTNTNEKISFKLSLTWDTHATFNNWVVMTHHINGRLFYISLTKHFRKREDAKKYFDVLVEKYDMILSPPIQIELNRKFADTFLKLFIVAMFIALIYFNWLVRYKGW